MQNVNGKHSRSRIFTKQTTFWDFLSQVIDTDGGCSEAVAKLRAFAALKCPFRISPSTGAYCSARKNLSKGEGVFVLTAKTLGEREHRDFCGRRVIVIDGTGLTAADTEANQAPEIISRVEKISRYENGSPKKMIPVTMLKTGIIKIMFEVSFTPKFRTEIFHKR